MRHQLIVFSNLRNVRRAAPLLALLAALLPVLVAAPAAGANPTSDTYFFLSAIGPTYGSPSSGFYSSSPDGLATDSAGNVYVTTPGDISKFNAAGAWVCDYGGDGAYVMSSAYGLDVASNGRIYVAESGQNRIAVLSPASGGVNATSYHKVSLTGRNGGDGTSGTGDGEFDFPIDVVVDGSHLYVADKNNNRIQKFSMDTSTGNLTFVAKWGKNDGDGTQGSGNGEFWQPCGIAADHAGHIFVTDLQNHRVQELTTGGAFVTSWGTGSPTSDPLYMNSLNGIDVDAQGNVYVTDFDASTSWVDKYAPSGATFQFVIRLGQWGTADDQFKFPWGVAVDPHGYLYVTDTQNLRLKKFARDATPPVVSVHGVPTGWTKNNVTVQLTATDPTVVGQYTSGFDYTLYSFTGGAPWTTYGAPFTISTSGDTVVTYRATDMVGNWSLTTHVHVRIDKVKPAPSALANVTVKKGYTAKFKYRVNDAPTPTVKVAIRIYRGATSVKTLSLGSRSTGTSHTYSWVCGLARGTYSWKLYATDLAGNVQAHTSSKKLTVT